MVGSACVVMLLSAQDVYLFMVRFVCRASSVCAGLLLSAQSGVLFVWGFFIYAASSVCARCLLSVRSVLLSGTSAYV